MTSTTLRVLRLPTAGAAPGTVLIGLHAAARAGLVARSLAEVGLFPTLAFSAPQLLHCLDTRPFDLHILDLGIADGRPEGMLKAVRARSEAALLALGGPELQPGLLTTIGIHSHLRADTPERVVAAQGAALLGLRQTTDESVALWWGSLELDVARRQAYWHGLPVSLTPLQFRILAALVVAGGAVVTKRDLQRLVWGTTLADDGERVAAHVRRIRSKLEPDPSRPRFLLTVRGEGYRLP